MRIASRLTCFGMLGALWLFGLLPACAGSSWQVINESNGLPSSRTTAFATSEKQMAVGTSLGVGIYDGDTCLWSVLPLPPEVASCEVHDLAFDREGNLWVATVQGLAHVQNGRTFVYGLQEGLPNIDVERIQLTGTHIFIGCFGGFICRGTIPKAGRTTFLPVNFDRSAPDDRPDIRSVGISAMAMQDPTKGMFSTKGAGLFEVHGAVCSHADRSGTLPSDWIETFTVFEGKSRREKWLVGTSHGLSLLVEGRLEETDVLPQPGIWVTGLVTGLVDPILPLPKKLSEKDKKLVDFLEKRYLWVASKEHGLWRFQDGRWTQYLPDNSRLPSRAVNRVFRHGPRIVACTDLGLVIVPLNANQYDEFKGRGLGSRFCLTLYPGPDYHKVMCPVNFIARGIDLWVSMERGLCRFLGPSGLPLTMLKLNFEANTARESLDPQDEEGGGTPVALGGEKKWQIFQKDPALFWYMEGVSWPIYSNKITGMAVSPANHVWIVFEEKKFARLRMAPRPRAADETHEHVDVPVWEWFEKSAPWSGDIKLTALWYDEGRLYVGTKGHGFYYLTNPDHTGPDEAVFDWHSVSQLEGLWNQNVIGFARRRVGEKTEIALLHPDGLTLWNGRDFISIDMGGRRTYTCITGDALGNLWIGSSGGLFRLTPDLKIVHYTKGNANFESDRITAVAASNDTSAGGLGIWVACDESSTGSDQPPNVVTRDGKKHVLELDIDGSSVHFYDGHTWDKWKMAGVRCFHMEGDYLFMGTNIRMRRLFTPLHKMKTESPDIVTSDQIYNQEAKEATFGVPAGNLEQPGKKTGQEDLGEVDPGEGGEGGGDGTGAPPKPPAGWGGPSAQEDFPGE